MTYLEILNALVCPETFQAIELGDITSREYLDSLFSGIDSHAEIEQDIELSRRLTELETKLAFYFKDNKSIVRLSYVKQAFYYLTCYLVKRLDTPKEIGLRF